MGSFLRGLVVDAFMIGMDKLGVELGVWLTLASIWRGFVLAVAAPGGAAATAQGRGLWFERVFCEKRFQLFQPSEVVDIQFSGMAQGF